MLARFAMRKKQYAFTLIELMVTLAVVAIVVGVAVPSFNQQIAQNRSETLSQDFIFALNFARTEAVKRSAFVVLCASDDGEDCSTDESAKWRDGFIAAVDYAASENADAPDLETPVGKQKTILRVWAGQNAKSVINVNINDSTDVNSEIEIGDPKPFIRFTKIGTLARLTNPPEELVLSLKMAQSKEGDGCIPGSAQRYTIGIAGVVRLINENCWE